MSNFKLMEEEAGLRRYNYEPSGLKVIHSENTTFPVAVFMITYGVGSRNEKAPLTGATHFLEHLMFKGTHRYHKSTGKTIWDALQKQGARMNATTWMDRTNYYEMLPSSKIEVAFDIESDRMRNLRLDPKDVASERTVILNELDRGQNQSSRMLHQTLWSTAFEQHPYHHPTIGWRKDVEQISAEGLRQFYDDFYWPTNATISVLGQISEADVFKYVEKYFGSIKGEAKDSSAGLAAEPEQLAERRFKIERKDNVGSIMIGFKNCNGTHDDANALDMLAQILSTNKLGRMYRELVDKGLAAGANAHNYRLRDPGLFSFSATLLGKEGHEAAEEAISKIVKDVREKVLTQEELDRARTRLKSEMLYAQDGPFSVASYLNEAIAIDDWRMFPSYLDRVSKITIDDVHDVAERYLADERRTVGYMIPVE